MGRHSAADGGPLDPVVTAALASRTAEPGVHRHGRPDAGTAESDPGWPEPPRTNEGLGWPGGMPGPETEPGAEPGAGAPAGPPEGTGRSATRRGRGWRRLFGAA